MLLKILLFVFLDGYCISCTRTERFLPSIINERKPNYKQQNITTDTKTCVSDHECFNADSITYDIKKEKKQVHDVLKRSLNQLHKKKQGRHKRFLLNGINLSGLVEQSYEFDESPPVKRDLFLYKEIFCPWDYSQLKGNYFNAPFFENKHNDENEEDHIRKKRFPQNFYNGNSENQFTSDQIEEFINLKTGERTQQKISNLEKAFQHLEQDITELAKLKSMTALKSKNRNKLSLNPKKNNVEVNLRMPSNIEHLDREIIEEVVRVDVPKTSKSAIDSPMEMSANNIPILQELLKPGFQNSFKNNKLKYGDKKMMFSPIENSIASYNIKLNKTNQNGEEI